MLKNLFCLKNISTNTAIQKIDNLDIQNTFEFYKMLFAKSTTIS